MSKQLVSSEILQKTDKILFLTHLALGDFLYMQNYFKAFVQKYPHVKIDIWVDEGRGKNLLRRHKSKGTYILYDWLESCCYFTKIYKNTSSATGLLHFLKEAKEAQYPIVVSLGTLNKHRYAQYASKITTGGLKVGFVEKTKKINFIKNNYFKKLNEKIDLSVQQNSVGHISGFYNAWFEQLFGIRCDEAQRKPFISIPKQWITYAKLKFLKWDITSNQSRKPKVIFINGLAKTVKRCWPMDNVVKLVSILSSQQDFYDASFIVNVMPDQYKNFEKVIKNYYSKKIFLFTADNNFFQLPAIISLCNLVISVETSIMHFAAALNIPLIALMRQKNPEWAPYGGTSCLVWTKKRKNWIRDITVDDVAKATKAIVVD